MIDWTKLDSYPESTCECACGRVFRSHSTYDQHRGLVSRKPCPGCGRDGHLVRVASDAEYMTLTTTETAEITPTEAGLFQAHR